MAQETTTIIQIQVIWMETNAELPEDGPQKTLQNLKIEYELTDFSCKAAATVEKTLDRCMDFYKRVIKTHNKFQNSEEKRVQEFPGEEDYLK